MLVYNTSDTVVPASEIKSGRLENIAIDIIILNFHFKDDSNTRIVLQPLIITDWP